MRDETSKAIDSSEGCPGDPSLAGAVVIARATSADEAAIVALAVLCEERPWSEKNIVSELGDSCAFHFLLRRSGDGEICSYILARFLIDELDINKVGTHPNFRRRGYARYLLNYALQEAKRRGGKRAFLEVRFGNTAAQECYKSIGFHVDSVRKGYYDSKEDALVMSRAL